MLRTFYNTAIRNFLKHKSYFLLNLSGLVIGISSFIFITLYIVNELSFDRFHNQTDQIYRVHVRGQMMAQNLDMAVTASPMAQALLEDYPEIEQVTRVKESGAWFIGRGDKKFNEDGVLFADSTFFDVFSFKLLKGDPKTALIEPRSMVMTASYATKYFGSEDPMGQYLTVEQDTILYKITGIMEDVPENSHIQFDLLGSRTSYPQWENNFWVSHNDYTYIRVNQNADMIGLEDKLQELVYKYVGPQIAQYLGTSMDEWEDAGNSFGYYLMPLSEIHLNSHVDGEMEANGHMSDIYLYAVIAFILLFIAIINFVNLATAQSAARAKEVGVRKVLGATKQGLINQFIFESILVSLFATILAIGLVILLTPRFENLIDKGLAIDLWTSPISFLILLVLSIIIGVLAGFYPAFVLAGFQPTEVLNGRLKAGTKSGWLRNLLVITQFTASIIIIIEVMVVYNQIDFMLTKNLGFNKEQVLVVRRPDVLKKSLEVYKTEILTNPNVIAVANATSIPGKSRYNNNAHMTEQNPDNPYLLNENRVSFGYAELMGLELVEGRFHSRSFASDSNAVVINETAVRMLGFEHPVGESFIDKDEDGTIQKMPIIGVVKDYNIKSLHNKIEPVMLRLMPGNWEGYLLIKIKNDQNIRTTLADLEKTWFKYSYNKPFQYFFFDEDYAQLYKAESTTGQVFLVFAGMSIFIACLGLIGLITFTTSVRKKEIGIRKVMGASTSNLVMLLSSEFGKLIVISTLISWPLAYFAVQYWLQNFADRMALDAGLFILSTLSVVIMGSIAISFQTIKTSRANPTDSLRQD